MCNLQIQSFIMMENDEIHVKSPEKKSVGSQADEKSLVLHYYITKLASSQSIKVRRNAQRKSAEDVQSQFKKSLLCSHRKQHQQTEPTLSGLLVVYCLHLFSLKPFSEICFFNGLWLILGSQGLSYLWHALFPGLSTSLLKKNNF